MSDKQEKQIKKSSDNKKGIINYLKELKAEFKRITWPKKKDIKKSTLVVVGFCLMYMAIVGVLDVVFVNAYKLIFK